MTWKEIMAIENPNEAMKKIYEKVVLEDLELTEMEERIDEYETQHAVDSYEMAYYPNGERVISLEYHQEVTKKREYNKLG